MGHTNMQAYGFGEKSAYVVLSAPYPVLVVRYTRTSLYLCLSFSTSLDPSSLALFTLVSYLYHLALISSFLPPYHLSLSLSRSGVCCHGGR